MKLNTLPTLAVLLAVSNPCLAQDLEIPLETYTLGNGLTVILHPDHTLPQTTVNIWFAVGSKDEQPGRSGFAHLFEHLMFMGTERVPGSSFDTIMEGGGGANNASTSADRTNYMSWGPPSLLPTLLWLDADRLEALGRSMTQEKLDLQRDVVRNELRQRVENTPYGVARIVIPEAIYPEGHPYHHPVIGSHEDLAAATLEDVRSFFDTYYVPANTSLVVAGDFDPDRVKELIATTFGAVPVQQMPVHAKAEPVHLAREVRRLLTDRVQFPRLYLVWHSPALFADGDAEMDLLTSVLVEGQSSRLYRRLVLENRLAREVDAYQNGRELGSEVRIEVTATVDADLERIKSIILAELADLAENGPTEAELQRVKAAAEAGFLQRMEGLIQRADQINAYRHYWGTGNGFARDLHRYTSATVDSLSTWAARVFGAGRLDLRILPEETGVSTASLDQRPEPFPPRDFVPPAAVSFTLGNGLPVHLISRPGTGLFGGALVVDGGDRLLTPEQAGMVELAAAMLTAGAAGKDAAELADAVTSLGAELDADASQDSLIVEVNGLASRLEPTLDLFADVILRANLRNEDFTREQSLALDEILSRVEVPYRVAVTAGRALLFGHDSSRGRPVNGYTETVQTASLDQLTGLLPRLLNPAHAQLVFAGDLDREQLQKALEARLGSWQQAASSPPAPAPALTTAPAPHLVLVDRPGAPQTVLHLLRPLAEPTDINERSLRETLVTILGGTFTSRLMQNIREEHGYSYGVRSSITSDRGQDLLTTTTAVQTDVTAAALGELELELERLATGDVSAEELAKALRTQRYTLVTRSSTTASLVSGLRSAVDLGLPLDLTRQRLASYDSIELDAVNTVARSGLFAWNEQLVVMVGDAAQIKPQLAEAGFGTPVMADAEGRMVEQE